jgi:hypothetical protein
MMMQVDFRLPTHEQCAERVHAGVATALDRFIYENEPAGAAAEEQFRTMLADVLSEVVTEDRFSRLLEMGA